VTPTWPIEIIGMLKSALADGVIDTGFAGHLCVPLHLAVTLGLVLVGSSQVVLADGHPRHELLFEGKVRFLDQVKAVPIFVLPSNDVLIGTDLLEDCQLVIDFPTQKVNLFRATPTSKK